MTRRPLPPSDSGFLRGRDAATILFDKGIVTYGFEIGSIIDDTVTSLEAAALGHNTNLLLKLGPATPLQAYATLVGACYYFGNACTPVGPAVAPPSGPAVGVFEGVVKLADYFAHVAKLAPNHWTFGADGAMRLGGMLATVAAEAPLGPGAMLATAAEELFFEAINQIYAAMELKSVQRATADAMAALSGGSATQGMRNPMLEGLPDGLLPDDAILAAVRATLLKYGQSFASLSTFSMTQWFAPPRSMEKDATRANAEAAPFLTEEAMQWGPISAPLQLALEGLRAAISLEESGSLSALDAALGAFERNTAGASGLTNGAFTRGSYLLCFAAAAAHDLVRLAGATTNSIVHEVARDIMRLEGEPTTEEEGVNHMAGYPASMLLGAAKALSVMPMRRVVRPDRMHTSLLQDGEALAAISLYYPEIFDNFLESPDDQDARRLLDEMMQEARALGKRIAPAPLSSLAQVLSPKKVAPFLSSVQQTPLAQRFEAAGRPDED